MASIDDILSTLQHATNAIDNAVTACTAALERTTQLQGQLAAAGVRDKVQQLAAAKDAIEKYRAYLGGSREPADRAIALVKATGG